MTKKIDCPYCEGLGEIVDPRKINSRSMEPPLVACPECSGSGLIYEHNAADVDTDKTLWDYELDRAHDIAERKREQERDR